MTCLSDVYMILVAGKEPDANVAAECVQQTTGILIQAGNFWFSWNCYNCFNQLWYGCQGNCPPHILH